MRTSIKTTDTTDTDEPKDHFPALGVDRNATHKVLRAAYYTRTKNFHPDKGGGPVVFERPAAAWEVLGDSAKHGCHDRGEQEPPSDRAVLQGLMSKLFPVRHWGELSQLHDTTQNFPNTAKQVASALVTSNQPTHKTDKNS